MEVGKELLVETADDDQFGVEDVDQVADAVAEPPARVRQRLDRPPVTGLHPMDELFEEGLADQVTEPGPFGQCRLARFGLPAAALTTAALAPPGVDQRVARLAGVAGCSQHRLAVLDDPAADPGLAGDEYKVAGSPSHSSTVFGEGAEVRLVGHQHRVAQTEPGREDRSQRYVAPAEVGSEMHKPV